MTVQPLSIPIYEITCRMPRRLPQALAKVVTENFTNCPVCHEHIKATSYYRRSKVIELMEKVGYSGDFISRK